MSGAPGVQPRRPWPKLSIGLAVLTCAAVLVAGFTAGWVSRSEFAPSPGSVVLESVGVNLRYAPGTWEVYGPQPPIPYPECNECPASYRGGTQADVGFWFAWAPLNVTSISFNVSVSTPFPSFGYCGGYSVPPGPFSDRWSFNTTLPGGSGCGLAMILSIPNPAPVIPPLNLLVNLTVDAP